MAYVAWLETFHIQAISDQQVPASIIFPYQEHQALVPLLAAKSVGKKGTASSRPDQVLEGF